VLACPGARGTQAHTTDSTSRRRNRKAADAEFHKLNTDHDRTLDLKELRGRVTKAEFDAADGDYDGTLDKAEYRALAQSRSNAANPDNDGTANGKEIESEASQRLVQLLK
jgi:hypothetical protein